MKKNKVTLQKLSVRGILTLGFAVILGFNLCSAVVGYLSFNNLQAHAQTTFEEASQIRELSLEIQTQFLLARQDEAAFLANWNLVGFENAQAEYGQSVQNHLGVVRYKLDVLEMLAATSKNDKFNDISNDTARLHPLLDAYEDAFKTTLDKIQARIQAREQETALLNSLDQLEEQVLLLDKRDYIELLKQIRKSEQGYFSTRNQEYIDYVKINISQLIKLLETNSPPEIAVADYSAQILAHHDIFIDIVDLDKAVDKNTTIFRDITTDINSITTDIGQVSSAGVLMAREQLAWTSKVALGLQVIAGSISLLLALGAVVIMARQILQPLNQLTVAAEHVGRGHFDITLDIEKLREFITLAHAFNAMSAQLRHLIDTLEEKVRARTQALETNASISYGLTSILDLTELATYIINRLDTEYNFYHTTIFLFDSSRASLYIVAATNPSVLMDDRQIHITDSMGLVARAAYTQTTVMVNDVLTHPDWLFYALLPETRAEMAVPIIFNNQVLGVLDVQQNKPDSFDEGQANLLQALANQIGVAINNAHLYSLAQQEINDRRKAEAALQQANADLAKANADKDKFFSIIAHDLKSPFKPVSENAETLVKLADSLPRPQIKALATELYMSAQNTLGLLENLLQWARLQMGRMSYQPIPLNLRQILTQTLPLFATTAKNKGIDLTCLLQVDIMVQADEYMLATIVRNLTNNALKFTRSEGRVILSAQPHASLLDNINVNNVKWVEVWVADNGVGISPENMAKLFKVGEQVSTLGTAKEKGTGLGLVMCQEMVHQHNGKIWAETLSGEGTTFKFTMPIAEPLPSGNWLAVIPTIIEVKPKQYLVPTKAQLEMLLTLAERADSKKIAELLHDIQAQDEQYRPFCEQVAQCVDIYDWAGVMDLVTAHLSE